MPANDNKPSVTGAVRSYAIRCVNSFLGVLQIIETAGGRAVSTNGVAWDIEIRSERVTGWGSLNRNKTQVVFYRYGLWSLEDGLVTRPLAPLLDNELFTQQCNILIDCIRERLEQLPFGLEDSLNVQAVSVEHHWHLYPEIIDENCISAARVQRRLQKANQGGSSVR